ncbi:YagK/YfjJ domain-containing protein [Pseudomonas guariconensis]|uniref:YagK/YfjJ domain-containing protein n=1 Tax=Pseudomonas guariconensis TaxID=1288410 RepID=UPI002B055DBB|nr:inovirus-type Gp2 protein [Pseudomonas guariconensis]
MINDNFLKIQNGGFEIESGSLSYTVTYSSKYRGFSIKADKVKGYGIITEIMRPIIEQVQALVGKYRRVTVLRFDGHFPVSWITNRKLENTLVSRFLKSLRRTLKASKWKSHKDIIYGWVYEIGSNNGRPHYHFFIGFEARYKRLGRYSGQGSSGVYGAIESCWKRIVGGHVHHAGAHFIKSEEPARLNDCIDHLSYMAKVRDKQFGMGSTAKNYSLSRLQI